MFIQREAKLLVLPLFLIKKPFKQIDFCTAGVYNYLYNDIFIQKGQINMQKIAIIANSQKDAGLTYTNKIREMLSACEVSLATDSRNYAETIKGADALIVLGGDGTILSCASAAAQEGVPMIGINLGTLGFLAEVEKSDAQLAVEKLLCGDYRVEERFMLKATVHRAGEVVYTNTALNDFVISRSSFRRIIATEVYVDGSFVAGYEGDGLILATPTGSTGYNLSAGGPIIDNSLYESIITPICPHTGSSVSVVVPAQKTIRVKLKDNFSKHSMLTTDGQHGFELDKDDEIEITASEHRAKLIKIYDRSIYDVLSYKKIIGKQEG